MSSNFKLGRGGNLYDKTTGQWVGLLDEDGDEQVVIPPGSTAVTASTSAQGVDILAPSGVMPVAKRKIPSDVEIMFLRPTGQQQSIFVPSPYTSIAISYVIHPSIVYIPEKLSGYQYWMAYTPLNNNDSRYENPCICASNDLVNWVLPEGCPNPIDVPANVGVSYNRDTHLYYRNKTLVLLWNVKAELGKNRLKISTSTDGVAWSAYAVIWEGVSGVSDIASPSLWYDDNLKLWVIVGHNADGGSREFRKITSGSLLSGWDTSHVVLSFPNAAGRKWWHSWFTRLASGRIVGLAMDNDGGNGTSGYLYVAQSMDGVNYESAIIQNISSSAKASGVFYRSTACFVETEGGALDITAFYSFTSSPGFVTQKLTAIDTSTSAREEYRKIGSALSMIGSGLPAGLLAATGFTAADSTTGLPATLDGKSWTQISGTDIVGISGNMAYNVTSGNCVATLDIGTTNYSVSVVVGAVAGVGSSGYLVVNRVDATHFWRIGYSGNVFLVQRYNGTLDIDPLSAVVDPPLKLAEKDILRVDVSGQSAKFYKNGILVYTANGTLFPNNSIVGLQAAGAGATKFNALTVEAI